MPLHTICWPNLQYYHCIYVANRYASTTHGCGGIFFIFIFLAIHYKTYLPSRDLDMKESVEREYDDILKRYVVYKKPLWIKTTTRTDLPITKKKPNADQPELRTPRSDPEINGKGGSRRVDIEIA